MASLLQGPLLTSITRNIAAQPRKHKITVLELLGLAVTEDEGAELLRHGSVLLPLHSILVGFAGRALGCANSVEFQKRVVCEKEDESLAYGASGTENTCLL